MAILRSAVVCCQFSELLKRIVASVFSTVLSMGQIDVTNVVPAGGAQHLFSHWRMEEFHSSERAGKLSAVKYRDRLDTVPCRRCRITYIVADVLPLFFRPFSFVFSFIQALCF
jgi:hypothetical protein